MEDTKNETGKKSEAHPEIEKIKNFGSISGLSRVGKTGERYDRAAMFEPQIKREWCVESGVPPHLYSANCFVGIEAEPISTKTGWSVKGQSSKKYGLDLSRGYWYVHGFDWSKNKIQLDVAQFKTRELSTPKKGKSPKYLSAINSNGSSYFLRITRAEIKALEGRSKTEFPYSDEIEEDDYNLSALYWRWAVESADIGVFITEGVKKAALMISQGYPCISLPGVNNIWEQTSGVKLLLKSLAELKTAGKKITLCFDADLYTNDQVKAAVGKLGTELEKKSGLNKGGSPKVFVMDWSPKEGKGVDDLFVKSGIERLKSVVDGAIALRDWQNLHSDASWDNTVLIEEIEKRHGQYYVSIENEIWIYEPISGCYRPCPEADRNINKILGGVAVPDSGKDGKAERANSAKYVAQIIAYIRLARKLNPKTEVNPPNKWCTPDGVIKLGITQNEEGEWRVRAHVESHEPFIAKEGQCVFTSAVGWNLDRDADSSDLIDVMGFCPEKHREALLDFTSCLLNPKLARMILPRTDLPALLLKGEGANGKDTFRKLLMSVLGRHNTSSINLAAIKNHDRDVQKFGLSGLSDRTLLNFSSENPSIDIAGCETFKALVTGDPVMAADKRKTQQPLEASALHIHCTNKDQYLSNAQYAIISRIAVIVLPYQFADEEYIANLGEHERRLWLSSRPEMGSLKWLTEQCAPAMFNEMLSRFEAVLNRGGSTGIRAIDWSSCDKAKADTVGKSNHLEAFLSNEAYVVQTENEEDFTSTAHLYRAYCDFCEDTDRAIVVSDTSSGKCVNTLKEADVKGHDAKYDPVCANQQSFSRKLPGKLGRDSVQVQSNGKRLRGFSRVLIPS